MGVSDRIESCLAEMFTVIKIVSFLTAIESEEKID